MSRKVAREIACQLVFEYLFNKKKNDETKQSLFDEAKLIKADQEFAEKLYDGVCENFDDLENKIKENIKDFSFSQVVKMDEAILLVALFELEHTDIDHAIIISEALNIAKKFSTEKSYSFINGVLSSILRGENGGK